MLLSLRRLARGLGLSVGGRAAPADGRTGDAPWMTFFGGKGGVGKTTCAAARALHRADAGARVLLVSTDPAHSLGDLLGLRLGARPVAVTDNLDALELDPERALKRYLSEVKENLRELASPELRDAAARQAELAGHAPGALDAALFDEVVRLALDSRGYDELVFDTAPTGHTLHLLALPEIMGAWSEGLLARRREARESWPDRAGDVPAPEDRAAGILARRRERFAAMRARMLDPDTTRFVPVLNPDNLSREETARMVRALEEHGIRIEALIINRILPAEENGEFMRRRREVEAGHLAGIEKDFRRYPLIRIAHEPDEIRGLDALRRLPLEQFPARGG